MFVSGCHVQSLHRGRDPGLELAIQGGCRSQREEREWRWRCQQTGSTRLQAEVRTTLLLSRSVAITYGTFALHHLWPSASESCLSTYLSFKSQISIHFVRKRKVEEENVYYKLVNNLIYDHTSFIGS